jgi:hypothetical protein
MKWAAAEEVLLPVKVANRRILNGDRASKPLPSNYAKIIKNAQRMSLFSSSPRARGRNSDGCAARSLSSGYCEGATVSKFSNICASTVITESYVFQAH